MNERPKFNVIGSIKVSDDGQSVWKVTKRSRTELEEQEQSAWAFMSSPLDKEGFQIQIINLISTNCESLQIGITSENPNTLNKLITDKDACLKNSLYLRKSILYNQNDENVVMSEEYELDLCNLCVGDLVGIKVSEIGELFFTLNGLILRKAADNIPSTVWGFVNLVGSCSCVSIIPTSSPITISHKDKALKRQTMDITDDKEVKVYFHNYCGKEVILTDNNRIAKRKNPMNEFRNAVVISHDPLVTNEIFRLRIEGLINKWNGSIELGVTFHNPDMFELPTAMNNLRSGTLVLSGNSILTNGHGTRLPYCTTSLDDLKIGDEIGIIRKDNSNIHFYINNNDMGVAGNIPIDKDLWVIADLYGRTIKVSIPRVKVNPLIIEPYISSDVTTDTILDLLFFHHICGKNVKLTDDMTRASRINDQEFNNGVVFSHRPLKVGEIWKVKLLRCVEQWAGNMEVGITTKCPNDGDIPSTMTDYTEGCAMMVTSNGLVINGYPLSQIKNSNEIEAVHPILLSGIPNFVEGNTIGVQLMENDKVQFFMNDADLGILPIQTSQDVYGVIDLYGKAAEVSICFKNTENGGEINRLSIKSVNSSINEDNPNEFDADSNYQRLLFSEDNNDFVRNCNLLESDSGLFDALKEADRSFYRLLSGTNETDEKALVFHHIHGRNVILTNDGRTAFRPSPNNEFKNALVMSSRPLETDEIFEICVDKMTDHWSGSLEMGVTLNDPADLNFPGTLSQLDKDCWILSGSCIMNNGITARNDYGLDMDTITVNSRIGLIRRRSGMLHFLLNGKDMGAAYFDVPSGVYAILDLYGQCSKVSLTERTGISIIGDQITEVPEEILTKNTAIKVQSDEMHNNGLGPSRLSPFERVMLVFKENITGVSEEEGVMSMSRRLSSQKLSTSLTEDVDSAVNLFDGDNIYGDGIRWSESQGFKADNQKKNCVIQSKHPLKLNVFYEIIFYRTKDQKRNIAPISFGFTTEKFSSHKYLADNMLQLTAPNWIFLGEKLLINNKIYSTNFVSKLSCLKKRLLISVYLNDDNSLAVYVDRVRVATLVSHYNNNLYMLMDLKGWYDSVIAVDLFRKVLVNAPLNRDIQKPKHSFFNKDNFASFDCDNKRPSYDELSSFSENTDIGDGLMMSILKELYDLLPLFMMNLKGIETSKLIEKMVLSNNDIVLSVRRDITKENFDTFVTKNSIRSVLVTELSKRFSYLTDLEYLGNSHHEVARVLSRRVLTHGTNYDINAKAFLLPQSCLLVEESKLSRCKPGNEFGLALINQELKSDKYRSYEIQTARINSANDLEAPLLNNIFSLGLIFVDMKHFSKVEDAFKFLLTFPCPKYSTSISNNLNLYLNLLKSEAQALILLIEDDSIFLNGKQISQKMPFNISNISDEQFISLQLRESETGCVDIYLSIRTNELKNDYLILSQSLFNKLNGNSAVFSAISNYFYIPFVWLKNRISLSIMTEPNNISQPLTGINQANRREWLEKYYNDELNKEVNRGHFNETVEPNDRQCSALKQSSLIKRSLALPESYFKNKSAICFCHNCRTSVTESNNVTSEYCDVLIKGDPAKEFRLPLGWVKYNLRLKREVRGCLSLWHLAYLTGPPLLLHSLLASADPVSILKCASSDLSSTISWLKINHGDVLQSDPPILVSPWQPLSGGYLQDDKFIRDCPESELKNYDENTKCEYISRIALEVRVKPNTYQSMEYKIISQNTSDAKCIVEKESGSDAVKKFIEITGPRSINQRTVWILKGEANSLVISGLLIK